MTPEIQAQIEALRAKVEEAHRRIVSFSTCPRPQGWTHRTFDALRRLKHEEYEAKEALHRFLKEHEEPSED